MTDDTYNVLIADLDDLETMRAAAVRTARSEIDMLMSARAAAEKGNSRVVIDHVTRVIDRLAALDRQLSQ